MRSFLRTPMDASKITSRFGMREHPILGFSALHAGVDFARADRHADPGRRRRQGGDGGPQRRLRHLREAAAHQRVATGLRAHVADRPRHQARRRACARARSSALSARPACRPARTSTTSSIAAGEPVNPLAQKFAMRAAVGGKDAARFQGLAKQYLAQMKNAPVVADAKPAKPKEPAAPQIAKGN